MLDSRSAIADARLNYGQPYKYEAGEGEKGPLCPKCGSPMASLVSWQCDNGDCGHEFVEAAPPSQDGEEIAEKIRVIDRNEQDAKVEVFDGLNWIEVEGCSSPYTAYALADKLKRWGEALLRQRPTLQTDNTEALQHWEAVSQFLAKNGYTEGHRQGFRRYPSKITASPR